MNNNNQKIKKIILLISTCVLVGCFETPSAPTSQRPPQPLCNKTESSFNVPEGTTTIRSAFIEGETPDWNNVQNWTTSFYKDCEIIGEDYAHRFVPCKTSTNPNIVPNIVIHEGTCFVNEDIEIAGLYMSSTTRMKIPKGVTVKNLGDVQTSGNEGITIDGGGDLYVVGESSAFWKGNAHLNKMIAPKVKWGGGDFDVNRAELGALYAKKIHVKEHLSVGEVVLDDTKDLDINHLHIKPSSLGKSLGNLYLGKTDHPLKIEKLSFEPGTLTQIRYGEWLRDVDTAAVEPVRLAGTLDVTNMNIFNTLPFRKSGTIGEKVPIIIAEKGIIGDMSFLRKYRRRLVTGCWGTSDERIKDGFLPSDSLHLVWVDGNMVYWQRMSSPLVIVDGSIPFIFSYDLELVRAHKDSNLSYAQVLNLSSDEWRRLEVICNAIAKQRKTMYEHASEAGIERFLEIQVTRDAKDRARKMLDLVDVTPYLNERGELSQQGEQAVVDSLSILSLNPLGYRGECVRTDSYNLGRSKHYGAGFQGGGYSLSGAFHQQDKDAYAPWVLGLDYRAHLQQSVWGVVRTLWEGSVFHPLTFKAKSGLSYTVTAASQITVLLGSGTHFGRNEAPFQNYCSVYPLDAVWALETNVEWAARLGAHEWRVGGDLSYRPTQTVPVHITDLAVTIDRINVDSGWSIAGSLSYAYHHDNALQYIGTLSVLTGGYQSIFGSIGIKLER